MLSSWCLYRTRMRLIRHCCFFFFNDTATTEIYTLSLHDALPIYPNKFEALLTKALVCSDSGRNREALRIFTQLGRAPRIPDRKSTRLNSSHDQISYAVFCLKKKKSRMTESGSESLDTS